MDNNIKSDDSVTCALGWTQDYSTNPQVPQPSLTELGGLEGAVPLDTIEGSVYGAEFMPVDMHTPYYEKMLTTTVAVPWLAQNEEATYMNRLKELNEPPVQTYRDLKLSSIPQEIHAGLEGFNDGLEGFDTSIEGFNAGQNYDLFFKALMILFLLFFIYYLMKQIK